MNKTLRQYANDSKSTVGFRPLECHVIGHLFLLLPLIQWSSMKVWKF